jgi:hypothetical protein
MLNYLRTMILDLAIVYLLFLSNWSLWYCTYLNSNKKYSNLKFIHYSNPYDSEFQANHKANFLFAKIILPTLLFAPLASSFLKFINDYSFLKYIIKYLIWK